MIQAKSYPAKLLLFGEYSIIQGSQALAIPFDRYAGHWDFASLKEQMNLSKLAVYLEEFEQAGKLICNLDLLAFKSALQENLVFKSSIPLGYGLGSSGALCAAIYDRFGETTQKESLSLLELKTALAQIESFFHGASSGIDPLVCYLQQALLIQDKSSIQTIHLPKISAASAYTIFLLDTHMPRETEPLVNIFLKQCELSSYRKQLAEKYIPWVDQAIDSFLATKVEFLFEAFHQISLFQLEHFKAMIPVKFQKIWQKGLDHPNYKLKLCGAGGGGFVLGITEDFETTKQLLADYDLSPIF